jgi:hypothetical protein
MLLNEYKKTYYQALADLLWRQWCHLGIAGHSMDSGMQHSVDPEALLIFTARFARYDQRLFDLIPEWLKRFGTLINLHRLKSLLNKSRWADRQALALMLAYAGADGDKRWNKFSAALNSPATEQDLFLDWQSGEALYTPHFDSLAKQFGFRRNNYIPTAKIAATLPHTPATQQLRLRSHYGTTARAEIILSLLTAPTRSAQNLAKSSGFTWGVVRATLDELICGGIVAETAGIGTRKAYTLTAPAAILNLLNAESISSPPWEDIYDFLGSLWDVVSNPRLANLSEATIRHEITSCFNNQQRAALLNCGIPALAALSPEHLPQLPQILDSI